MEPATVAVIGLGALGLVTVKNLAEAGFAVTGFDRNEFVGGLWHYTDDDRTSALKTTVINISVERSCFTDFPFPKDAPPFAHAHVVEKYLEDYTDHFNLRHLLRLSTPVKKISPPGKNGKWAVALESGGVEYFDKVVTATGINQVPVIPEIPGIGKFEGRCLHSRAYKQPKDFEGCKVLVVGLGNTGADTASTLVGHAEKIYASHRAGALVIPRMDKGKAFDHGITARTEGLMTFIERHLPSLSERLINSYVKKIQDKNYTLRPEWNLWPAPSLREAIPIVSDDIVRCLEDGSVTSVVGVKEVVGPGTVELTDGTKLEVDVIIYCTGYRTDYSLLDESVDPCRETAGWASIPGVKDHPLPKLYQNVFSLDHPDSLALMGCAILRAPAFQIYDLAAMAVAQVWSGKSKLPPVEEMRRAADEHVKIVRGMAADRGVLSPGWVNGPEWMAWVNEVAGTGVDRYLGWGWEGIRFWVTNWRLCGMLMGGLFSPHIFRVFETGKRRRWEGAVGEVERVNERVDKAAKAAQAAKAGKVSKA